MAVPKEIRDVERPINSIVKQIGDKWAVIKRIGCERRNGKNYPINGPVVGHIVDGVFIPKVDPELEITSKSYGDYMLARSVSLDLLDELKQVYSEQVAFMLYVIALLRSINPDLKDSMIEKTYEESFVSNDYPFLNLNKNQVSEFIRNIGRDYRKVLMYIQNRVEKIDENNKIAIDGMLKNNNSRINSLNEFSYKSRIKNSKNISILVAFNITTKDVICSLPYSGNCVDITSFPDFLEKTNIKKGIIIGDKGLNSGTGVENVGYIFPVKRSLKILNEIEVYDMREKLNNKDRAILCKKTSFEGKYYYAFKDIKRASKEEQDFINGKKFDGDALEKRRKSFGTIVYVSDQNLTCEEAYNLYRQRWEIELVNDFYKNTLELDTVREHDDYSVYGSEFINMLTLIIGYRIKNKFEDNGLFEKHTYGELMKIFKRYQKVLSPSDSRIWYCTKIAKKEKDLIKSLIA